MTGREMVPWGTAIVGDVLSTLQIPGSGIFGKFGEKYLERKQKEAAELLIEEVLQLKSGSVVPLDKLAGDPVDILVNGRLVARGEVLVLNDNFCVRVAEIVAPAL